VLTPTIPPSFHHRIGTTNLKVMFTPSLRVKPAAKSFSGRLCFLWGRGCGAIALFLASPAEQFHYARSSETAGNVFLFPILKAGVVQTSIEFSNSFHEGGTLLILTNALSNTTNGHYRCAALKDMSSGVRRPTTTQGMPGNIRGYGVRVVEATGTIPGSVLRCGNGRFNLAAWNLEESSQRMWHPSGCCLPFGDLLPTTAFRF